MRHYRNRILSCALSLALVGCAGLNPPSAQVGVVGQARVAHARVVLQPSVTPARGLQAVINAYTASSINRLDVVPYVQTTPGTFWPLSASTGTATDSADPAAMLRVTQSSPSINVTKPIVLDNLQPNVTYRFYARAYDSQGTLISSNDSGSYAELAVGNEDRPTLGALPIKLVDRAFSGSTTVRLAATGATSRLNVVTTDVFTVVDGVDVELAGSAATTSAGLHPDTVTLSNLQANSTYRVKAEALDASASVLATASADVVVTNDDAPPPVTLTLAIPSPEATTTTLAGTAGTSGTTDDTGTAARFNNPCGVTADGSGNLYVADSNNHTIRKIVLSTGEVTTLAGTAGVNGSTDGTGTAATFSSPRGLAADGTGNLYVADSNNQTIRKIVLSSGVVTTLAGAAGSAGSTNGTGSAARFFNPLGLAADGTGNLYVADSTNSSIRKIVLSTGVVTTLAGTLGSYGSTDGTGTAATFKNPAAVTADGSGTLYVADTYNHTIRKIVISTGVVTTLAGTAGSSGSTNGTGTAAKFNSPKGLALDGTGNLFVTDLASHTLRKIVISTGAVTTLAGTVGSSGSTDGTGSAAKFDTPYGIAADSSGNLYVGDYSNNTIRKIVP
ncbi:MAG TPA: NHL repeat-containing protein [Pantanalinema sp.]